MAADEGSKDWLAVGSLRRAWYCLLGSIFGYFVVTVAAYQVRLFATSEFAAAILRLVLVAVLLAGIAALFITCRLYYAYALQKTVRLTFNNIFFFYVSAVLLFATCYIQLYRVDPSLFSYANPPTPSDVRWVAPPVAYQLQRLDFILFSAIQSVNGGYYRISSHSLIISFLGYVQAVFTICLLALLVAAYVSRKSKLR